MTTSRTGSTKWLNLRTRLIRTRPHVCAHCGRILNASAAPRSVDSIELDHVVPVTVAPALEYDPDNLVLSCHPCNRSKGASGTWRPPIKCKVHDPPTRSCPHSGSLRRPQGVGG